MHSRKREATKGAGHKMSPKKQRQGVFQAIGSESGKEGRKQKYLL